MFMDVRMCECIVCMKEKLIKYKRVASGHQTFDFRDSRSGRESSSGYQHCHPGQRFFAVSNTHFNFSAICVLKKLTLMYGKLATTCIKYQEYLYGSEAITYLNVVG
jgi:hypothetical protein